MKHETYLESMRVKLGMWPEATRQDLELRAMSRMEVDGAKVRLDQMSDHRFPVRVRKLDGRRTAYNQHTTSTSGYPILAAYEKYQAWEDTQS